MHGCNIDVEKRVDVVRTQTDGQESGPTEFNEKMERMHKEKLIQL